MFNNKSILITGGTGSFGQEVCKELLLNYSPKRIIVFSRDELKQYEMAKIFTDNKFRFFIGDIRDKDRLLMAMRGVDLIIHAAAMKQVEISEYNPFECIKTNINGAQNIIEAAIFSQVKKVIVLSSDKAVSPLNLYGATKLASEKLFIAANNIAAGKTIFSAVRYGNVSESRGSVIPIFKNLIKSGSNYLPITDLKMTRFFILLNDGVKFVLNSLKIMKGGEIFIPKLKSFRMSDLVKALAPKKKIKVVGIRPGEKIHEILFSEDESRFIIEFKKYFVIPPLINLTKKKNFFFYLSNDKGKKITEKEYSSEINNFLSINEIKKILNVNN